MGQFILLLHGSPTNSPELSPEEIQRIIEEYTAWRDTLMERDMLAGGNKLKDASGRILSFSKGKTRVVDGPYSEAKEVIGGYFIIKADDYDHAVEISSGCPHLKYGGSIELREIDAIHD